MVIKVSLTSGGLTSLCIGIRVNQGGTKAQCQQMVMKVSRISGGLAIIRTGIRVKELQKHSVSNGDEGSVLPQGD